MISISTPAEIGLQVSIVANTVETTDADVDLDITDALDPTDTMDAALSEVVTAVLDALDPTDAVVALLPVVVTTILDAAEIKMLLEAAIEALHPMSIMMDEDSIPQTLPARKDC